MVSEVHYLHWKIVKLLDQFFYKDLPTNYFSTKKKKKKKKKIDLIMNVIGIISTT